ncbi:hypothetical protein H9Y04_30185 [Streptomyces sp. TRM66268-LWL]|uniref:Lipoprotein n=2 Tax=Streptomyces polyasparticus TaxID=2767826 RepID=A0ABR7SMT8_9ACTN|nr:hypothetical protein [Streptomyces polyasparticus]
MRGAMVRGILAAALTAGLVAGCSGSDGGTSGGSGSDGAKSEGSASGSGKSDGAQSAPTAKASGSVGAPGSACELPVTYKTATKWEPESVDVSPDDEFAEMARQGPVLMRCEISSKAIGKTGFLRTYVEEPKTGADPRKVLELFVAEADGHADEKYTPFKAGSAEAVEVVYTELDPLFEEKRTARAFAVATPQGTVVVALGGSDQGDTKDVQAGYRLAKSTLRVNG